MLRAYGSYTNGSLMVSVTVVFLHVRMAFNFFPSSTHFDILIQGTIKGSLNVKKNRKGYFFYFQAFLFVKQVRSICPPGGQA